MSEQIGNILGGTAVVAILFTMVRPNSRFPDFVKSFFQLFINTVASISGWAAPKQN